MGVGPGSEDYLPPAARRALEQAEVIVGYHTYLEYLGPYLVGRQVVTTGMTEEVARCREAIRRAEAGQQVALVCGGDPGVYGLASLVLELLAEREGPDLPVEIIPGLTAALAAAARLGAPLGHDFAVISLSDRLTPWEVIERRLRLAAEADLVLALYNPRSHGRQEQILRAQQILLEYRPPQTPVGVVQNVARTGERWWISNLERFTGLPIDMATTVIIGSRQTRVLDGRMVTPRGYRL
ncbi:MAG: precorrin-3B C(17)-methyltransferase [Moorellales bacterium]